MTLKQIGDHASDFVANKMPSWTYVFFAAAFIWGWMQWNGHAPSDLVFDKPPFLFLNLILSLASFFMHPLGTMANKRNNSHELARFANLLSINKESLENSHEILQTLERLESKQDTIEEMYHEHPN